ncbi:MAG: hypothetical protein NVSMB6_22940 [Burkholderiaceae bacterium]
MQYMGNYPSVACLAEQKRSLDYVALTGPPKRVPTTVFPFTSYELANG